MKLSALIALAALLLLCGCTVQNNRCYPIMGLGWMVVNTNRVGVTLTKTTVVGLGLIPQPIVRCIIGYGQVRVTQVETNVVVEIRP